MLLPKPIRKWVAVFRGDVAPVLILLSAMLGFWFGLTPGWYGIHVSLLVLALILNVHIGLFLLFAGIGKGLAFAAAPVLYYSGVFMQGNASAVLEWLGGIPILGMTDTARYSVAGAMLLGPVVGALCGLVLLVAVGRFRKTWLRLQEGSDAFRRWRERKWIRFLDWFLIGKSADVRSVLQQRAKIVRKAGIVVAVVVLVAGGAAMYAVQGEALAGYARQSLTGVNGAEVNIDSLNVAVFGGRVSAEGIQATDPARPTHNRFAASKLTADVSLWSLLLGRLVMDDVELSGVTFDQKRESPGEVIKAPPREEEAEAFDPSRYELPIKDVATLESYIANARKVRDWLVKIREWLPEREEEGEAPKPAEPPERYLEYLYARAQVPPAPTVIVRRLVLDPVEIDIDQFGASRVECQNLSDAPGAAALPVTVAIKSNTHPSSVTITSHYEREEGGAEVAASFERVDLKALQRALENDNPVVFEDGTASAAVTGIASREQVDLAIKVKTEGMRVRTVGGAPLGLDPKVAEEAVKALEDFETTLRLVGPTTRPRLVFDRSAIAEQFRTALVDAGKAELVRRLDEELGDQLPGGIPDTGSILEDPGKAAKDALKGLTDGDLLKKKEGDNENDNTKDDILGGLKDALKKKKDK
jgi:uncharacterized protein (TIGR03546 family)